MGSALALISLSRQNKNNCFRYRELSRNTILNMRSGRKVCKKWRDGFCTQTITQTITSHQNLLITFWPVYNVPWNIHANLFRGACFKSTNYQAKIMRKQSISIAQV